MALALALHAFVFEPYAGPMAQPRLGILGHIQRLGDLRFNPNLQSPLTNLHWRLNRTVTILCRQSKEFKMRIALFTETFLPKIDGIVNTLCYLLDHLAKRGHTSLLVVS
jgi:hypothetical protein